MNNLVLNWVMRRNSVIRMEWQVKENVSFRLKKFSYQLFQILYLLKLFPNLSLLKISSASGRKWNQI